MKQSSLMMRVSQAAAPYTLMLFIWCSMFACAAVAVDAFATSIPSNAEAPFDVAAIESLQQPAVLGKPRRRRRSVKKHGGTDPSVSKPVICSGYLCFHMFDLLFRASLI